MRGTVFLLALIVAALPTAFRQPRQVDYDSPPAPIGPCRGEDLSVRHVTDDAAMGGLRTIDYAFKNKSSASCTLKGYPRYELLDKSGVVRPHGRATGSPQLPVDDAAYPPQLVTIAPGKEAGFRVYYNSGGAGYVGKPCPVSRRVRIAAPGTTRRFVLREDISLCGGLQVSGVRKEVAQESSR